MKFKSKTSGILITFFIAAIIVSFALTGFQDFGTASSSTVAKVGASNVTYSEYRRSFDAQSQRFSQIFGGKALTQQQIKQFRIKENTLRSLVQQKLILNLANEMDFNASKKEVKDEIKKAEYFKTGGKFDVNKYKSLLKANRLSPARFEEMNTETIKMNHMRDLFATMTVSKTAIENKLAVTENTADVNLVEITKENLVKFVNVSKKEISEFIKNKDNKAILTSLFNASKSEFNKPQRVKARHILLKESELAKAKTLKAKLTTKNFASIAGKETQDPSGKDKKGGDLGWFTKGKMVPEFEKVAFSMKPGTISDPVKTQFGYHIIYVEQKDKGVTKTLEQVQDKIAKKHLQKTNRERLKKLQEEVIAKTNSLLAKGQTSALSTYAKKYELNFIKDAKVNALEAKAQTLQVNRDNVLNMINNKNTSDVFRDDEALKVTLYKATKINSPTNMDKVIDKELTAANTAFSNRIQEELLKELEESTKVVTYPKML